MRAVVLVIALVACQKAEQPKKDVPATDSAQGSNKPGAIARPKTEQITPPVDLKNPPADVIKTPSGLMYKKLVTNESAPAPGRNDTVMINYTGWQQSTGETFFTKKSRGQPMPLNLSTTAPGFTEAMQLLHKGERAILWVPPSIGYKGQP